jgi:hypothetical protein
MLGDIYNHHTNKNHGHVGLQPHKNLDRRDRKGAAKPKMLTFWLCKNMGSCINYL